VPPLPELIAGAAAGLAVAMPVGAVGAYLLGLAARSAWRTAAAAALGVATVDGVYAVVAALGGLTLSRWLERVGDTLEVVAALVLVAVATRTAGTALRHYRHPVRRAVTPAASPGRAYLALVAMTAVNPATLVTFGAVALGRLGAEGAGWTGTALFAAGAFAASAAWQLLLAGSGSVLGRLLRGPRAQLGLGLASGAVMLALAAGLVLGRGLS
jgi:arginine exporter protein ArgO